MNFDERYARYAALIEPALHELFGVQRGFSFDGLLDAMDYSLTAGGKRIRPVLTLAFAELCGGDAAEALPVACAVELLHTYSLIHDDLPCMDNDELRRGRPTNHVVFGECTATLAGDALQAEAFGTILRSPLPAERRARCAEILAGAAGIEGICGGQYLDMLSETRELTGDELSDMQGRKTGSLLAAACAMGVAAAGGDGEAEDRATRFGAYLGAAFQIRDDMLDALSTPEVLGKSTGKDRRDGKTTFMTLYGEAKCADMVSRITEAAVSVAAALGDDAFPGELARRLASRNK